MLAVDILTVETIRSSTSTSSSSSSSVEPDLDDHGATFSRRIDDLRIRERGRAASIRDRRESYCVTGLLGGGYALQRLGNTGEPKWLLIKLKDEAADARRRPTSSRPRSVLSGRRVGELEPKAAGGADD